MRVEWLKVKFGKEEISAVKDTMKLGDISGFSPVVTQFEDMVKSLVGVKHAIACTNGTVALITAYMACAKFLNVIKPVIAVPTWSYIAPANAASLVGSLRLIDSNLKSHNMVENFDGEMFDIISPVDMAGVPADYDEFLKYKKMIVADAAESLGAFYKGRKIGTLADITITSFQSAKIITTGEGGMLFTDNDMLALHCRDIINQGYDKFGYAEHYHVVKGYNFRMSAIHAAIGCIQLKKLDENIKKRKKIAKIYNQIDRPDIYKHEYSANYISNNYSHVIMLQTTVKRNRLMGILNEKGIDTKLWRPIHHNEPYKHYGVYANADYIYGHHLRLPNGVYANADYIYGHHLRLPIHNEMTEDMAEYVAENIQGAKL